MVLGFEFFVFGFEAPCWQVSLFDTWN